jgi:hypothetical protein
MQFCASLDEQNENRHDMTGGYYSILVGEKGKGFI